MCLFHFAITFVIICRKELEVHIRAASATGGVDPGRELGSTSNGIVLPRSARRAELTICRTCSHLVGRRRHRHRFLIGRLSWRMHVPIGDSVPLLFDGVTTREPAIQEEGPSAVGQDTSSSRSSRSPYFASAGSGQIAIKRDRWAESQPFEPAGRRWPARPSRQSSISGRST